MYDKRFRAWGIKKYFPKAEKDKLLTWYSQVKSLEANATELELNEGTLRKALRYQKDRQRGTSRDASRQRRTVTTTLAPSPMSCRSTLCLKTQLPENPEPSRGLFASAAKADTKFEWSSTEDEVTLASTPSSWSDVSAMDIPEIVLGEESSTHDLGQVLPKPPIPPTLSRQTDRTALLLLQNVQYYCGRQLDLVSNGNAQPHALSFGCSPFSVELRDNLSNGLYLLKISSVFPDGQNRAWPALHRACAVAKSVMHTEPFDLLRVVLATLSPANTTCHLLALRAKLLKYLGNIATDCLGPMHPLPAILEQLQRDQDDPAVASRGLICMSDVFSARLGAFHDTTLRLQSSLVVHARRSGDLDSTEQTASSLLLAIQARLGERSPATRRAAQDLAHIKMARKQYTEALQACDLVLGRPVSSSPGVAALEVTLHEDDLAVHSMEDVAEIFEHLGDIEAASRWLRFAAEVAVPLWGREAVGTAHIIDKLALMLRDIGQEEDAARWATFVEFGR